MSKTSEYQRVQEIEKSIKNNDIFELSKATQREIKNMENAYKYAVK